VLFNYQYVGDFYYEVAFIINSYSYAAIGNVSGSKVTDERQTRFRVGVKYSF